MVRHRRDDHKRLTFNIPEQEHILNTHIDQLAQWYADAERITDTNLPCAGDILVFPYNADGYAIEVEEDDWTPDDVVPGEPARILARAPKPKPAWHDADFIVARYENDDHWQGYLRSGDLWIDSEGQKYTTGVLRDVIPLIGAKVTDEMIDRILDVIAARFDNYPAGIGEELAVAALGIEAE